MFTLTSCKEISKNEITNPLDPENQNFIEYRPENIEVYHNRTNSARLRWTYPTTNYHGFLIESRFENQTEFEQCGTSNSREFFLEDLDTNRVYFVRIVAFKNEVYTSYSEEIKLEYTHDPSFNLKAPKQIQLPGGINSLALSSLGEYLVTSHNMLEIREVNSSGKVLNTLDQGNIYNSLCYSSDNLLLAGAFRNKIRVWSNNYSTVAEIDGHSPDISEVCFTPNNDFLIWYDVSGVIKLLNVSSFTITDSIDTDNSISCMEATKNSDNLIVGFVNEGIKIYNLETKQVIREISEVGTVHSIDISKNEKKIAYSIGTELKVLNFNTNQTIITFVSPYSSTIHSVSFTYNGIIYTTGLEILGYNFLSGQSYRLFNSNNTIPKVTTDFENRVFAINSNPVYIFDLDFSSNEKWLKVR